MKLLTKYCLLMGMVLFFSATTIVRAQEEDGDGEEISAPLNDESLTGTPEKRVAPRGAGGKEVGVLDFEGELIEGTRKRPDLFLQTGLENLTLDAILFLRKDFNDYHQVDRMRRPGYVERKTRRSR